MSYFHRRRFGARLLTYITTWTLNLGIATLFPVAAFVFLAGKDASGGIWVFVPVLLFGALE